MVCCILHIFLLGWRVWSEGDVSCCRVVPDCTKSLRSRGMGRLPSYPKQHGRVNVFVAEYSLKVRHIGSAFTWADAQGCDLERRIQTLLGRIAPGLRGGRRHAHAQTGVCDFRRFPQKAEREFANYFANSL